MVAAVGQSVIDDVLADRGDVVHLHSVDDLTLKMRGVDCFGPVSPVLVVVAE